MVTSEPELVSVMEGALVIGVVSVAVAETAVSEVVESAIAEVSEVPTALAIAASAAAHPVVEFLVATVGAMRAAVPAADRPASGVVVLAARVVAVEA